MLSLTDASGFPLQGGVLDKVPVAVFGIIVLVVVLLVVLMDAEFSWRAMMASKAVVVRTTTPSNSPVI